MPFYTGYKVDETAHLQRSISYQLTRFDFAPKLTISRYPTELADSSELLPARTRVPAAFNCVIFLSALVAPSISNCVDMRPCVRVHPHHSAFVFVCLHDFRNPFYTLCHRYRFIIVSLPQEKATPILHFLKCAEEYLNISELS